MRYRANYTSFDILLDFFLFKIQSLLLKSECPVVKEPLYSIDAPKYKHPGLQNRVQKITALSLSY